MNVNRRESQRTSIVVDVQVGDVDKQSWKTRTKDVSDTGAFVLFTRNQKKVSQGETIWLQVQNNTIESRRVAAEVVRIDSLGAGIRFRD